MNFDIIQDNQFVKEVTTVTMGDLRFLKFENEAESHLVSKFHKNNDRINNK